MNAKQFIVSFLIAAIVAIVGALPVAENAPEEPSQWIFVPFDGTIDEVLDKSVSFKNEILNQEEPETEMKGLRFRRATCDLLSFGGKVNHSACAAHCLVKRRGFKGGYCEKGVCHCRR